MNPYSHIESGQHSDVKELLNNIQAQLEKAQKAAALYSSDQNFVEVTEAGQRIRKARKSQKMSIEDLADLADVSQATLGKLERGLMQVQLETLIKISDTLGLKVWVG